MSKVKQKKSKNITNLITLCLPSSFSLFLILLLCIQCHLNLFFKHKRRFHSIDSSTHLMKPFLIAFSSKISLQLQYMRHQSFPYY